MSHPHTPPDVAFEDRRDLFRYPFPVDVICRAEHAGPQEAERARVCDVSVDGLALLVGRRYSYGEILLVELVDTPQSVAGTLMLRVRNVRRVREGEYIHGCRFVCYSAGTDMTAAFRIKLSRPAEAEQRTLPRFPFVVPISCRAVAAGRNATWTGTTLDLSSGGLRLTGDLRLSADTLVTVKLSTDYPSIRSLTGRVRHARGVDGIWEFGCVFPRQLSPQELHALVREAWRQGSTERMAEAASVAKLKLALADHIEQDRLSDARQTVISILRLEPTDPDALAARAFLQATPLVSPTKRFEGHKACVNAVAFLGGHRLAVSGSGVETAVYPNQPDNSLRFWDVATGTQVFAYTGHATPIVSIALARQGTRGLTASRCGTLLLWDMEQRGLLRRFESPTGVNCVALSDAGNLALSGDDDGFLRVWDANTGHCIHKIHVHERPLTTCCFLPGDRVAATGSEDRTVRILGLEPPFRQHIMQGHMRDITAVATAPDGRRLASASLDGTIRIWTSGNNAKSACLTGHNDAVHAVAFSPDGKYVLSGSADNSVRLWDAARAFELACLTDHTAPVTCVAFSSDGRYTLSGGDDHTVRFWQLPSRD